MLALGLWCAFSEAAALPLEAWRGEVGAVRQLAEGDAQAALARAGELHAGLPGDATPTDRVNILNLLARAEAYMALSVSAERHARAALALANREGYRVGQAEADLNLALVLVNLGKLDELPVIANHALAALEGADRPDLLGEAFVRAAAMYYRVGLKDQSATMTLQGAEIVRRSTDPLALAYGEQGLAYSFRASGHPAEAWEHYEKMRGYARVAGAKWLEAEAQLGKADQYGRYADPREAEALAREAVRLYREFGSPFGLNSALVGLAGILSKQNRHAEAHRILDEVVARYAEYPNPIPQWYSLEARAASHRALGNGGAARRDAERAHALARELGFPQYRSASARHLAEILAAQGDHAGAYRLSVEATEMAEQQEREKRSERILELARRYEVESRQREINELTSRNRLQAAEIRQRELQRRTTWGGIGGGVLVLAGLVYFLVRQRRAEREIRALNAGLELRVRERTAELRQQARYWRTLIDALPIPVWLKDTDRRFLAINEAGAARLGLRAGEVVGATLRDFATAEPADFADHDEAEVLATGRAKVVEIRSGATWREIYCAPVLDEDGAVLGGVGVEHDISPHKALEEAQAAALAEEKQLAKMRTEFMAQVSHELRTPLNGILGYVQLLQSDATMGKEQLERLGIIRQSGDHLLALINNILDHVNLDAEKLVLQPGNIVLARFFDAISGVIRGKAERKHLEFTVETAGSLPAVVRADEQRLNQVLLHLLDNAVKFTEQGRVTLRADFVAAESFLHIEVRDSGVGIDESRRESIFGAFGRINAARRWYGGAGLGLPVSRKLARLMGGDVRVERNADGGSTFLFEARVEVIRFPTAPDDYTLHAPPLAHPAPLVVPPPASVLESLYAQAQRGNMKKLAEQADYLAGLDERHAPFADRLRMLCRGYQSQAILSLIEQFREQGREEGLNPEDCHAETRE